MKIYIFIIFVLFFYIIIKRKISRYSEKRELKKCESPIEIKLFEALIKQGYQVYTQVPCGRYRIDLAIFLSKKRIAIEADGRDFHSSFQQKEHDNKRDLYLKKHGWEVIRFTGSEIYRNSDKCVEQIGMLYK